MSFVTLFHPQTNAAARASKVTPEVLTKIGPTATSQLVAIVHDEHVKAEQFPYALSLHISYTDPIAEFTEGYLATRRDTTRGKHYQAGWRAK